MSGLLSKFCSSDIDLNHDQKYLLAISGGIDSMVMLHLFMKKGLHVGIAHCNFKLRGGESDGDEHFIKEFAAENNIPFHATSFETSEYAEKNKISIQMAARDLRYEWFFNLSRQFNYDKISLAHNLDDKVETFFINLVRGTGLKGITGMQAERGEIIRPLLSTARAEIEAFAKENQVTYREDSSNKTTKYLRNKLRHDIIPGFKEIDNSFLEIMDQNLKRFEKAFDIYTCHVQEKINEISITEKEINKINIEKLKQLKNKETILFEILSPYHFSHTVVSNILGSIDHQSGLRFLSPTHKCIKDRQYLIISKIEDGHHRKYYIEENSEGISYPVKLNTETFSRSSDFKIISDKNTAQIDYNKLIFPLILRKWENGDYFMPLGMNAFKKLSDFFINNKFSLTDKENTWILTSGEKIVWIVGHRIDERFKIDNNTQNIFKITKV